VSKTKLGWLALGAALLAVGAVFLYKRYALPQYVGASNVLIATENALATPETLFLGSVDLEYIKTFSTKLQGRPALPDLATAESAPGSVLDTLGRLVQAHSGALSYFSAAVYLTKDGAFSTALVAGGDIRVEEIIKALQDNPQAKPAPNLANAWIVQVEDPDNCRLSKEWTVVFSKNRIVAVDGRETGLIERLQSDTPAARNLDRWREFRKDRFAAAALFPPEALPQGLGPLVQGPAETIKLGLNEFDGAYLGASARAFPPSGKIALWLSARSPAVAAEKARAWQAALVSSRKDWEKIIPTFAVLHDRATIGTRDNLLLADISLDKSLADQLRNLPGELIALFFSGFNFKLQPKASDPAAKTPTERIDKQARQFIAEVSAAQLKPFDPETSFAEPADVVAGPFGIQLAGIRLTESEPRTLELEVRAAGTHLPNSGDNAEHMLAFSIASVRDKDGKELLQSASCGPDRNALPAHPVQQLGTEVLAATKKVHLIASARPADVASIQGAVRLNLPTRVETIALTPAKAGDRIEPDGLRIELTQVEPSAISYRVSGDTDRLLLLRAKNAKGEVLAQVSSFKMDGVWGSGKSVTQAFAGVPASVEFVVARAVEQKNYAFELKGARPQSQNARAMDKAPTFGPYPKIELGRDLRQSITVKRFQPPMASAKAGPAIVDLEWANAFKSLRLGLALYLPPLKNLEGALSAAEVEIQGLTLVDGTVRRPRIGELHWRTLVPMNRAGNELFSGRAAFDTGIESPADSLRSIAGRVSLHLPLVLQKTSAAVEVGAQTDTSCGSIELTEITRGGLTLAGAGDPACLFAVRALNAEGKDLRVSNGAIEWTAKDWRDRFTVSGIPSSLELVTLKKSETLNFPFVLQRSGGGNTAGASH